MIKDTIELEINPTDRAIDISDIVKGFASIFIEKASDNLMFKTSIGLTEIKEGHEYMLEGITHIINTNQPPGIRFLSFQATLLKFRPFDEK